jgi:hypothetical protein
MLLPVDHDHGGSFEDDEDLLLVTLGLVVLGDPPVPFDLDGVHAERSHSERLARERPSAGALEIVPVLDDEPLTHVATSE